MTIRLKTATPYPLMLNDLSAIFIVSKKATQGLAREAFAHGKSAIGTRDPTGTRISILRSGDHCFGVRLVCLFTLGFHASVE